MARIRSIKIDFFHDEDLCDLPFEYRLLFAGLWLLADREGRLEDRPRYIKTQIFPHDEVDVETMLETLSQPKRDGGSPFIHRYSTVNSRGTHGYIEVVNFLKHQRPHHTEKQSDIPSHREVTVNSPLDNREPTVKTPLDHGDLSREGKGMEGKGKDLKPSQSQKPVDKSKKDTATPRLNKDNGEDTPGGIPVDKSVTHQIPSGKSDKQAIENLGKILQSKRMELGILK